MYNSNNKEKNQQRAQCLRIIIIIILYRVQTAAAIPTIYQHIIISSLYLYVLLRYLTESSSSRAGENRETDGVKIKSHVGPSDDKTGK